MDFNDAKVTFAIDFMELDEEEAVHESNLLRMMAYEAISSSGIHSSMINSSGPSRTSTILIVDTNVLLSNMSQLELLLLALGQSERSSPEGHSVGLHANGSLSGTSVIHDACLMVPWIVLQELDVHKVSFDFI